MRYFDEFHMYAYEDILESLRNRIDEAKKPLPKKIMKHYVSIVQKTSETSFMYCSHMFWHRYPDGFKTREQAEKFLNSCSWLIYNKEKDIWVEYNEDGAFVDKDGNTVPYHYMIRESDCEVYEDEENHFEYTEEEIKKLEETLDVLEKAKVYLEAYDYCCEEYSFGYNDYTKELNERLDEFEQEKVQKKDENEDS